MKVECIKGDGRWCYVGHYYYTGMWPFKRKHQQFENGPKLGDIVTVDSEFWSEGVKYYRLVEWPRKGEGFTASAFKPLAEQYDEVTYRELASSKPISVN